MVFQSLCLNDKETVISTDLVQFASISRSQIYSGEFLKFTGMQFFFSVSKWPPQAVFRMYTEQNSFAVGVVCFKSILQN